LTGLQLGEFALKAIVFEVAQLLLGVSIIELVVPSNLGTQPGDAGMDF